MPLLIGIDEVGYGPKLGPLIVSAVVFRVPDPEMDLWDVLGQAVTQEPGTPDRLPVCDSKKIFSQRRGIASLHATVCAFLAQLPYADPLSYPALTRRFAVDPPDLSQPWYGAHAETVAAEPSRQNERLASAMRQARVTLDRVALQVVEPTRFNDLIHSHGNKSIVLFRMFATLLQSILSSHPDPVVHVFAGKHGGRQFYLPDLVATFPNSNVTTLGETPEKSSYAIARMMNQVEIHFLMNGEDRHFGIALASMIGKYVRELGMGMFNRYWQSLVPELRPTAGYHPDADRFLSDIKPALSRQKYDERHFIRIR